jgi:hypothetical protein
MNTPIVGSGWMSLSVMAFAVGLILVAAFVVNVSRQVTPDHLSTIEGRVTEIHETKGAVVFYLVPSGASSDAGRYYRYLHTSGASGVVAVQLQEATSNRVTLRYSETNSEVFEILNGEHVVRSLGETLSSRQSNDMWLLGVGLVLLAGAARPAFRRAKHWLASNVA